MHSHHLHIAPKRNTKFKNSDQEGGRRIPQIQVLPKKFISVSVQTAIQTNSYIVIYYCLVKKETKIGNIGTSFVSHHY